jgi:hypothetical protein
VVVAWLKVSPSNKLFRASIRASAKRPLFEFFIVIGLMKLIKVVVKGFEPSVAISSQPYQVNYHVIP